MNMVVREYADLVREIDEFNKHFIKIKIAVKNIDKMGIDVTELYKQIDNIGIEIKKENLLIENSIKEHLDIDIRL